MSESSGSGTGTRTEGPDPSRRPTPSTSSQPSMGSPSTPPPADQPTADQPTASQPTVSSASPGSISDDTAVRPPLRERIQAKLSAAADDHRASAVAKSQQVTTSAPAPGASVRPRAPRRARLRLTRIDPWSVMKTSFLLAIAFGVVTVVAVAMVWSVLDAAGVWDSINTTIKESVGGSETANLDVQNYVGTSRVLGFTMIVAAVDVVLITAIATLGAFLYNMSAALLGGIEVTLAEDQH